jgi:hypothetical protein
MLNLSVNVQVPNIAKMRVVVVDLNGDTNTALVTVAVQGAGGAAWPSTFTLGIRDGSSEGLRAKGSPLGYGDILEVFGFTTPTGFTDLVTAYVGGGISARNKAVESYLVTLGALPAGTVA